jgi:hypothetical protein
MRYYIVSDGDITWEMGAKSELLGKEQQVVFFLVPKINEEAENIIICAPK